MSLPSQMDRTSELGRPFVSRRSGKGGKQITAAVGIGAIVLVGVALFYGLTKLLPGDGPKSAGAAALTAGLTPANPPTAKPAEAKPELRPADVKPAAPAPVTLRQGEPARPEPVDVNKRDGSVTRATAPTLTPGATGENTLAPSGSTADVRTLIESGDKAQTANNLVQARVLYSRALLNPQCARTDQEALRTKLTAINETLLFSTAINPTDPLVESYTVQSGDNPTKIARKQQLATDLRLISRINRIDPGKLKIGQKLKLVRGPFHAVVTKSDYRLDLFAGSPDEPDQWIYIRSFKVGLGTENGTPLGTFVVKRGGKMEDPPWTNPKTGEKFASRDPKNPIGKFWIGLEGQGSAKEHTGYGLHGTIEPESIGQQKSMGCVRMLADDISLVFDMLVDQVSVVKIQP